jgi:hypothetical protein
MHWRWSLRASGISNTDAGSAGVSPATARRSPRRSKRQHRKGKAFPRRRSRKVIGNMDNVSVQFEVQPSDLLRANLWWFSKRWLIRFVYAVNLIAGLKLLSDLLNGRQINDIGVATWLGVWFLLMPFVVVWSALSRYRKRFKPFANYSVKNWGRKRASRVKLDGRLSAKLADLVTCPKDN